MYENQKKTIFWSVTITAFILITFFLYHFIGSKDGDLIENLKSTVALSFVLVSIPSVILYAFFIGRIEITIYNGYYWLYLLWLFAVVMISPLGNLVFRMSDTVFEPIVVLPASAYCIHVFLKTFVFTFTEEENSTNGENSED